MLTSSNELGITFAICNTKTDWTVLFTNEGRFCETVDKTNTQSDKGQFAAWLERPEKETENLYFQYVCVYSNELLDFVYLHMDYILT